MSVQPGLRGSNDLRVGRKMAAFQLFFQSGRAKDLSAPLYYGRYIAIFDIIRSKSSEAPLSPGLKMGGKPGFPEWKIAG